MRIYTQCPPVCVKPRTRWFHSIFPGHVKLVSPRGAYRIIYAASIEALPNEVLLDIVHYLKANSWELTPNSIRDLASVGRTSSRFYELATPILYERVTVSPRKSWPEDVWLYRPNIETKRGLSFVRTLVLDAYAGTLENADKRAISRHCNYLAGCLRVLKDTKSVQSLSLDFGLYDASNSDPTDRRIDLINRDALDILDHVSKMRLKELKLTFGYKTACIEEILSIIGRKVDEVSFHYLPLDAVASRLRLFRRLKSMRAALTVHRRDAPAEALFWSAVSELPTLHIVDVDTIPFPPPSELQLPQIVTLNLSLSEVEAEEWAHSVVTVFTQMSGLESITISRQTENRTSNTETRLEANCIRISSIACVNLRELSLDCMIPRDLISKIAKHCMHLTKCDTIERDNVDGDDIRQLSLSCPNLRELRLLYSRFIASGLEHLAALHQLTSLKLHYTAGRGMEESVLPKFASSCPKLEKIIFSDWNASRQRKWRPRPFEETACEDLFPAAAKFPLYFEPKISKNVKYHPDGLDEYVVRLDKFREDMFQFKQLTERLGRTFVRFFPCMC
jgi:hypothetical protein